MFLYALVLLLSFATASCASQEKGCDLVLPLCHLYENQDEITCRNFDFPVILSLDQARDDSNGLQPKSVIAPSSDALCS